MPVKFQGGTEADSRINFRVPVLLSLLVILLSAGTIGGRALLYLRSPEQALGEAALRAATERDRLVSAELAWAEVAAGEALAAVASGNDSSLEKFGQQGDQERSILLQRGDRIVAAVGPQRFLPQSASDGVSLVTTPFQHALTVHRHRGDLAIDITILLDAVQGVPRNALSLAERAEGSLKTRWSWGALSIPRQVSSDSAAVAMVRARMSALAPSMADLVAREQRVQHTILVLSMLLLALIWTLWPITPRSRAMGLMVPLWVLVLAGAVPNGLGVPFGVVTLGSISLLLLSARRSWSALIPRGPGRVLALGAIAATPLLARFLADFVVPEHGTNRLLSWFLWQGAVAIGLFTWITLVTQREVARSSEGIRPGTSVVAVLGFLLVGLAGIEAWQPADGWQPWLLPLVWIALGMLLLPMQHRGRLVAVGTAAAVMALLATWGTSLNRRMAWADADLSRLALPVDSSAATALDDFALTAREGHTTGLDQLFAAWSGSDLAHLPVPTHLAISDGGGRWLGTVALDSIYVDWNDLDSLVGVAGPHPYRTEIIRGGIAYQVLVVPFAGDTVATVTIGPRTELLSPTRFGHLVGWRRDDSPGYTLIGLLEGRQVPAAEFDRRGRFLNATRTLGGPENRISVRARIEMPPPQPFAVRASLALLLDCGGLLTIVWLVSWGLGHGQITRSQWLRPSYRTMVAGALTGFFVVPALLFTSWSVLRVRRESVQSRDEEVQGKLRSPDAFRGVQIAQSLVPLDDSLQLVAFALDAELGVYRDNRLVAASTPTLASLGLMPVVLPPGTIPNGAIPGEPVVASLPWLPSRLGLQEIDGSTHVLLAAVLPAAGGNVATEQLDLVFLLLLTTLAGGLASFWVADRVARTLADPIERLRQSALAFGRGELMPPAPPAGEIPTEFVPVFDAMAEMVEDLQRSEAERVAATAQTAKVVAWGEMARQVAHEIKNPLTPMRLGLQHLRRLQADQRSDFPEQVGQTADRLLSEVERLDRIARAFARYGSPPAGDAPISVMMIGEVLQEVVELFALSGGQPALELVVSEPVAVAVRREELIQVLLNLLENARHAGASRVAIELAGVILLVADDGRGIATEQLDRVFEPTFSTNTSGTGLGLPIVRRLVEGWGGEVRISSEVGGGTTVEIRFMAER